MGKMDTTDCELIHGDCLGAMAGMGDGAVDCIVTDPPYLYLTHRLDRAFDIPAFAREAGRVLAPDGLIAYFGRGAMAADMSVALRAQGLRFLEEVVWDKRYISSPMPPILRRHEMVHIYGKGGGRILPYRVPIEEEAMHDPGRCLTLLRRILKGLNGGARKREAVLQGLLSALETKVSEISREVGGREKRYVLGSEGVSMVHSAATMEDEYICAARALVHGGKPVSIQGHTVPRGAARRHPTEKPVGLLRALIGLCCPAGGTVLDPFMGSGSTGEAARGMGRGFVGVEIDGEYFGKAKARLGG